MEPRVHQGGPGLYSCPQFASQHLALHCSGWKDIPGCCTLLPNSIAPDPLPGLTLQPAPYSCTYTPGASLFLQPLAEGRKAAGSSLSPQLMAPPGPPCSGTGVQDGVPHLLLRFRICSSGSRQHWDTKVAEPGPGSSRVGWKRGRCRCPALGW